MVLISGTKGGGMGSDVDQKPALGPTSAGQGRCDFVNPAKAQAFEFNPAFCRAGRQLARPLRMLFSSIRNPGSRGQTFAPDESHIRSEHARRTTSIRRLPRQSLDNPRRPPARDGLKGASRGASGKKKKTKKKNAVLSGWGSRPRRFGPAKTVGTHTGTAARSIEGDGRMALGDSACGSQGTGVRRRTHDKCSRVPSDCSTDEKRAMPAESTFHPRFQFRTDKTSGCQIPVDRCSVGQTGTKLRVFLGSCFPTINRSASYPPRPATTP